MKTITKTMARKIITNTKGKIFKVKFLKKDNSVRELVGRIGVTKHLKNGKSTIAANPDLIGVYEMKDGYKCFNINRLIEIKVNGQNYIIED